MTTLKPISKVLVAALLLCAAVAQADVMNGDFENGPLFWSGSSPFNWILEWPAAGGNPGGYAAIQSPFGGDGGLGIIEQTFVCGDPGEEGTCTITVDYSLLQIDASNNSGRIIIRIDGVATTFTPQDSGWYTATLTVPCGTHHLELCLQVDPINNGWRACFDNVAASCDGVVPSESTNWSTIKALYN
jgi:hypothetical protein